LQGAKRHKNGQKQNKGRSRNTLKVAKVKRNMQKCRLHDGKTGKHTPLIEKKHYRYLSGKLHNAVACNRRNYRRYFVSKDRRMKKTVFITFAALIAAGVLQAHEFFVIPDAVKDYKPGVRFRLTPCRPTVLP
jgi:hypothetical protein